jgi:replicative DNA helicase
VSPPDAERAPHHGRPTETHHQASESQDKRTAPTPLEAAHYYASRGWRVVPIVPGEKRPAINDWVERATTDPEIIAEWWTEHPDRGVGIVTGERSNLFVLDVDGDIGRDALADLEHEHGALPDTVQTITGSGCPHYLFAWPGWNPGTNAGVLGPGLDIRAEGGQIVAPPTIHPNGRAYMWEVEHDPRDGIAVARAPEWLLDLLRPAQRPALKPRRELAARVGEPRPGDRFEASVTWPELLEADGAQLVDIRTDHKTGSRYELWTRPGKDPLGGASASLYYGGTDLLKVFSTNWPGLTAGATYSKFGYLAATKFGGDHSAAARDLRRVDDNRISDWIASLDNGQATSTTSSTEQVETASASPHDVFTRGIRGGSFIHDAPDNPEPVCGHTDAPLWARGESLLIVGPAGVGKTTSSGQLVAAGIGVLDNFLGLPVTRSERTLYLACDRPAQFQRAARRVLAGADRELLDERLVVWKGPPPRDFGKHPDALLELARAFSADRVFIDSLKDVAIGLSDDEVGAGLNSAIQLALAEGIDVCGLHHQRKGQAGAKPVTLEDVYGSVWITAGAGSVALLWGQPGDPVVEFKHLKQPAGELGPFKIEHNHDTGLSVVARQVDPLEIVRASYGQGVSARELAGLITEKPKPTENERKKAERQLDRLVAAGLAYRKEATRGGAGGTTAARYFAIGQEAAA